MKPPEHPTHPRQLPRSKWTSRDPALAYCHWTIIELSGNTAVLAAVLEAAATHRIAWRDLRDRERWLPGWK